MKSIKFALLNIKKNFKNAKELKSAFIMSVIGMCINNSAFIILWYNFGALMGNLNGWDPIDVFGLYAFSAGSFGIVCAFFKGIINLPIYISTGNLDKYLNTPKNTLLKIATSDIDTSALGDLTFGFICFIIYAFSAELSILQVFITIIMMIVASIVFFSFVLICMTISFYLMDGENVSHGLYQTFLTVSLYHGGAFTGILKIVFVFIIPSLLLGAIPVEIVKNISFSNVSLMIILAIIWLVISVTFFNKSLKKYESNNFFGFGNWGDDIKDLGTVKLETERLILRKFKLSDIDKVYNGWATDKESCKYLSWEVHKNTDETKFHIERWIKEYEEGSYHWVVELKDTKELIGAISAVNLNKKHHNVEVGYCYGSKYWGKGYGTEALRKVIEFFLLDCEFYLVEADHISDNPASGRVMEKAGMRKDGILRDRRINKITGEYNDVICYSITKDEL